MNRYATVRELGRRLGLSDTSYDGMLEPILDGVSRQIDQWTGHHFYTRIATRRFSTPRPDRLLVPDLLAVTTLKTDSAGDLSYATTWAPTDYVLLPGDGPFQSPPHPYWEVRTAPGGANRFGGTLLNVQIAGGWGFYKVLARSPAMLAEDLDTSETAIEVDDGAAFEVGQTLTIDDEQMDLTDILLDTLTVTRAINGTTAAVHSSGGAIDISTYPVISEACLLQAGHLFESTRSPGGIVGSTDTGVIRIAAFNPLVRMMLQPFRRPGIAVYGD